MASSPVRVKIRRGCSLSELLLCFSDPHPRVFEPSYTVRKVTFGVEWTDGSISEEDWDVEITDIGKTATPDLWKIEGKRPVGNQISLFKGTYSTRSREGELIIKHTLTIAPPALKRKLIIVVRSGGHRADRNMLTHLGQQQLKDLAAKLAPLLDLRSVRILCPRERQEVYDGDFLSECLNRGRAEPCDALGREALTSSFAPALKLIREKSSDNDVVIVIIGETHSMTLPSAICLDIADFHSPTVPLNPGQARIIHLDEKRTEILG